MALFLTACSSDEKYDYSPRAKLMYEFVEDHLQPGISRERIVSLLGRPYNEGVRQFLPEGITVPDSIRKSAGHTNELREARENAINDFYRTHSQPDTVIEYMVGDGLLGATLLVIKLDDKGLARDFIISPE
ncbi:hypothetical protein [Telluribacter sp. SYSU D00476]|uniref:hypothetical protein n=1 Tax=Telluribacter sp. SYSU D00476 TaxID=2811430 RepID=UPI001FF359BD|nr:hypothetical protein [Telluribacter sp. SYSU D00476]